MKLCEIRAVLDPNDFNLYKEICLRISIEALQDAHATDLILKNKERETLRDVFKWFRETLHNNLDSELNTIFKNIDAELCPHFKNENEIAG